MKNFKVLIHGGEMGLEFFDLIVTKDGQGKSVNVKKGCLIPVNDIPADMLQKSLESGCLSNAIRAGWVIEVGSTADVPVVEKSDVEKAAEFDKQVALKAKAVEENSSKSQAQISNEYKRDEPKIISVSDGAKVVDSSKPEIVIPKVEITAENVKTLDDFNNLKHFSKLGFISKCVDTNLLKEISEKADSKQLRSNAIKKLKSLEK